MRYSVRIYKIYNGGLQKIKKDEKNQEKIDLALYFANVLW